MDYAAARTLRSASALTLWMLLGVALGTGGEVANTSPDEPAATTCDDPAGIHNLLRVSERIYSGSEPHGEPGMASLKSLGVKTIVSVDGAKPNVELARQYGLRYVHIPIGYDGVPTQAGQLLARLVREAEPPYYIHCHHGRHRGPAAVAVACIAAGEMQNDAALNILHRAGTSKDYLGLWRDVERYVPPPADAKLPELVEVARVDSFVAAMAQVDRSFDNLVLCREASWGVPPGHPDVSPPQEALLLAEGLHEAVRTLDDGYDEQFRAWLKESETLAASLRSELLNNNVAAATAQFTLIKNSCKQCHQAYRD